MALPTITPVNPAVDSRVVMAGEYLRFIVADADTTIDLANTNVLIEFEITPGVWIPDNAYIGGAGFQGTWGVDSGTVAYAGPLGAGFQFNMRDGVNTWETAGHYRVTVDTQDLDAPPDVDTLVWEFYGVPHLNVSVLEQVDARTIQATFTNQLATSEEATQNALPTCMSLWSASEYLSFMERVAAAVPGDSLDFAEINHPQIRKITRGPNQYPDQLMLHTSPLQKGESYFLLGGSMLWSGIVSAGSYAFSTTLDLVDVYGNTFADFVPGASTIPMMYAQHLKTDQMRQRFQNVGFDVSENSNVMGLLTGLGKADDDLGGAGRSRLS
jgi:hypothetical protein